MPVAQHKEASKKFKEAAEMHDKAAGAYEKGDHKEGAHFAQAAVGHKEAGKDASREASKEHAKKYGNK